LRADQGDDFWHMKVGVLKVTLVTVYMTLPWSWRYIPPKRC